MNCKYCKEKIIKGDNHTNVKNICVECTENICVECTEYDDEYMSYYE